MANPIKTIVILVQENRSFDHMLGWMKSLNPEIDGVTGNESNPVSTANPDSGRLYQSNEAGYIQPDPGHSFQAVYEQVFGKPWRQESSTSPIPPTMEGFAQQAESVEPGLSKIVMSGFKPDDVPVYRDLVMEFAVCDRWFASVPASTQPNRLYVHSATSHGAISNDTVKLIEGFPQKTIFESLDQSGFSFGIYYQYPPSTLFYRNLRKLKYINKFHQFDLDFKRHCKEGKLPNYVVVEQRYFDLKILPGNDDHPSHDVSEGQKFVKEVYEALRSSPQWNEILFVVTYDEHGGFYDHVPTPVVDVPSPDGVVGPPPYNFRFDRLGVRVPAILISPWIERGTVLHEPSGPFPSSQFEHSSIPATVKKIFNLKEFLTKRDEWAGTFEGILTRTTPRTDCPFSLPEPEKMRHDEANENANLTEFQEELVQLGAVLKGDHKETTYPDELVENMKVNEAVEYVGAAFKKFCDDCEIAKREGKDDSYIVCDGESSSRRTTSKTFTQKLLSCFISDH
ncbi:hypothetical protein OSB04_008491 [Centaurea solstitialis]|uniref:Uncharacterized protein n=1 Tax=Centaurea solstitialis TaxID=347529 RepID=A0AA38WTW9_9ASTR|nr:hypothetical protein OSB04_008491 [Centaurea solstitialis]